MERNARTECWSCKHQQKVPGNAHIKCAKPDPEMRGSPHGVKNGWFFYPFLFDPTWKEKSCSNYEAVIPAISQAVSQETSAPNVQA